MKKNHSTLRRRSFLKKMAAGTLGGAILPSSLAGSDNNKKDTIANGVKLGISTYSYWHFDPELVPIQYVIEEASRLGVPGVDILHRQMESEEPEYVRELKQHALRHGVHLNCLSTHQDFVNPDPDGRQESVDDTHRYIRLAHDLGISCIRVSAGRWGTSDSFSDLMDQRGKEPPIEGYTEEDAFEWCIEALEKCVPVAEKYGVMLGLENHWGMTRTADGLLRIMNAIDSPWLRVLMDTGNFLDDTYQQIEAIAPYTVFVQAKTYYGEGLFYTLDLDYPRIARILNDVGYKGYVSIEFEGHAPSEEGVANSVEMLREAFSRG